MLKTNWDFYCLICLYLQIMSSIVIISPESQRYMMLDFLDWKWTFHGQVLYNEDEAIEMKLTRCLSRHPDCEHKHIPQSRFIEPAEWIDPPAKIIRIKKLLQIDYIIFTCSSCSYFRGLWNLRCVIPARILCDPCRRRLTPRQCQRRRL